MNHHIREREGGEGDDTIAFGMLDFIDLERVIHLECLRDGALSCLRWWSTILASTSSLMDATYIFPFSQEFRFFSAVSDGNMRIHMYVDGGAHGRILCRSSDDVHM